MLRLFCTLTGLVLFSASAVAESRSFRDWTVECDEQLSCRATTVDASKEVEMWLLRHGYEGASWQLLLRFKDIPPPRSGGANFTVDDGKLIESPRTELFYDGVTVGVGAGDELNLLFAQIKNGKDLKIFYDSSSTTEKKEEHDIRLSLSGLAAALLWIDEKQERIGKSNDISHPAGVNSAFDVVASDKAKTELGRLAAPVCPAEEPREIKSYRLPSRDVLHVVTCNVDLKNSQAAFFRENVFGIRMLLFADYSDGWKGMDSLPNADFDPTTGLLQSYGVTWGLDWIGCQYEGRWVWSDSDFTLLKFEYVADCEKGRPEEAKVLYKRQVN